MWAALEWQAPYTFKYIGHARIASAATFLAIFIALLALYVGQLFHVSLCFLEFPEFFDFLLAIAVQGLLKKLL